MNGGSSQVSKHVTCNKARTEEAADAHGERANRGGNGASNEAEGKVDGESKHCPGLVEGVLVVDAAEKAVNSSEEPTALRNVPINSVREVEQRDVRSSTILEYGGFGPVDVLPDVSLELETFFLALDATTVSATFAIHEEVRHGTKASDFLETVLYVGS